MQNNYYIHNINPLAIEIGTFTLPWYWLVYFVGLLWTLFMVHRLNKELDLGLSSKDVADYFQWSWISLFFGARLFYILVYNLDFFLQHPHMIPKIWLGGMSFHGALLGITFSLYFTAKWKKQDFLLIGDCIATVAPMVLGFGRIANFINGELAGRAASVPWAVIFPRYKDGIPRHPSQLYQAILEGFILFFILRYSRGRIKSHRGHQSSIFLIGYGIARFVVEFFREADPQLGYYFLGLTMGQLLCLAMILTGAYLITRSSKSKST
ncbi:MAG: prolipoprotein diacylglyceryl transferase [Bacteriovoracaceae bacterium]|jgi:phosphatidylglycerol---prolipoprotein diacylglyceryl transferase|nr:prolipoprotein diacylglyceryl transferase [Bacteriovoracaceae bacterium]